MSADEAMWHYIGRNWFRNGLVPYAGGIDNHSPLIFAIFGLSDKLFGVNYWFTRLFGTLCQSVGVFYVYKIAAHISGKKAGLLAMSFYGLAVMWHGVDGRYVSYTETYDVMFVIIAFYYCLSADNKKGYFLSGFLAAVGLGFRLSAFFGIVPMLALSCQSSWRHALAFCTGLLSGAGIIAVFFLLAGINLHNVFLYAFADNWGKGSTTDHEFWWQMVQFHNMFFYSEVMLFYPFLLAYIFIKKRLDWAVQWSALAFTGIIVIGNYARVDLKDLLPPLALVAGLVSDQLLATQKIQMKYAMLTIWICFSPKIVEPIINFKRLFTGEFQFAANYCHEPYVQPDESASRQLGWWIRDNTKVHDKVLVAGFGSLVQAYSERESPSVYFNATQTLIAKSRFYQDLQQQKPEMILVPLFPDYKQWINPDLRQYVDQLVSKDYYFETCMFNYSVYRIKR